MDDDGARRIVYGALATVAPEADLSMVDPDDELQQAVDLDSIDFLNVVTAVADALGVDIPERDYGELVTLGGFVAYVARQRAGADR